MSTDKLGIKYSLKSILDMYDRIEIPVIQRDYAQGREGKKETQIRRDILKHILGALLPAADPVELDFVYGIKQKIDLPNDCRGASLIPIDGQQRLTTLWLIHCYLAGKAGLLQQEDSPVKKMLLRFTYETRVSSKDFMQKLCNGDIEFSENIKSAIMEDAQWFDEAWKLDPSVMGFLTMLDAIANHPIVKANDPLCLYERLTAKVPAVSFYFLSLDNFGLGEEIYTRMNARGKVLSDFEKFKSNFFKIIEDSPRKEEISQKIEYEWVTNLWPYREKNVFVTDVPFMNWLRYITMMLITTSKDSTNVKADDDYMDWDVLARVYSKSSNLDFLIHSLDSIPVLASAIIDCSIDWSNEPGLKPAIKKLLDVDNSTTDVVNQLCLYAALLYIQQYPDSCGYENMTGDCPEHEPKHSLDNGLENFVRVTRNLIANTADRSVREWPAIIESISKIIHRDVYSALRTPGLQLQGLRSEQREIEIFKAKIIESNPKSFDLIVEMDEDPMMKAREGNLIVEMSEPFTSDKFMLSLSQIEPASVNLDELKIYFTTYKNLHSYNKSKKFNGIWGELLQTELYKYNDEVCWWTDGDNSYVNYAIHPVMMKLVRQIVDSGKSVEAALEQRQRRIINKFIAETEGELSQLTNPKDQLYLLYVATIRILELTWSEFFVPDRSNRFNFGWVDNQSGYSSPFIKLIESSTRKIYQTYPQRFRSDTGVVDYRTPHILKAHARGKSFFDNIIKWAIQDNE